MHLFFALILVPAFLLSRLSCSPGICNSNRKSKAGEALINKLEGKTKLTIQHDRIGNVTCIKTIMCNYEETHISDVLIIPVNVRCIYLLFII